EIGKLGRAQPLLGVDLHAALQPHFAEAKVEVGNVGDVALLAYGRLHHAILPGRLDDAEIPDGERGLLEVGGDGNGAIFERCGAHRDLALAELADVETELAEIVEID